MTSAPARPLPARPLFTRPEFRAVAGEALRPGGLALTRRALALAGLAPGSLVADLGCGPGATARLLASAGHRVLALDAEPGDLPEAKAVGVLPLRADAARLPLPEASLDGVFCECVLSVTCRAQAVLQEIGRVLRPGGVLALSDLCRGGEATSCGGAAPAGGGDCLSGALPLEEVLEDLRRNGMALEVLEDHSRRLAELAGRLLFAGMPADGLRGCSGTRPGYFLCLARKAAT